MTDTILIYGANGYTGKLIARTASDLGLTPILAGRNAEKVSAVAEPLHLPSRAFDLADPGAIDAGLDGVAVVLCIAGPFSATSRPMADACIRRGVHYLDVTGEIDVFEALAARDEEAKQAGVMLLPGVGYDVVPSDCLAAHLKRRMPDAVDLKLYLEILSPRLSRGTAKTLLQELPGGTRVRRAGLLVTLARPGTSYCDFGNGLTPTMQISWGDVSTAFYSTGIPNIEVHNRAIPVLKLIAGLPRFAMSFLGLGITQSVLQSLIERQLEGPSDEARRSGRSTILGIAHDAKGGSVRSRLRLPDGYTLTAMTALDIAKRVARGEFKPGFQTPSLVFGPEYILGFEGVTWEDLST
jgi:short subunit dehydrogenase-like uncharacterized protein